MENLISKKIAKEKATHGGFEEVANLFTLSNSDDLVTNNDFLIDDSIALDYIKTPIHDLKGTMTIKIPSKNEDFYLELMEVPSSFYNYNIITSGGTNYTNNHEIRHYRGIIKGDENSLVAMSFTRDEVYGIISTKKGNYNLSSEITKGKHVLFNDKSLSLKNDFECTISDNSNPNYLPEVLFEKQNSEPDLIKKCIRIYLETEYNIFQELGSIEEVEKFIVGIFNQVAILYENENIQIRISDLFIWNTKDPYKGSIPKILLNEFQANRTTFNGDLGQLLSFRTELKGGVAAGFNGLCNPDVKKRLSVSMIQKSYNLVPAYSWTVQIITHELGHLLGSRHTHACVWNGNNTAIDGCANVTEYDCPIPQIPLEGGTIMSYCHFQSVGINFNLGFGPQPGNVIRNMVKDSLCICECANSEITGSSHICTTEVYEISNFPKDTTIDNWEAVPSSSVNFSELKNPVTITKLNGFNGFITLLVTLIGPCGKTVLSKRVFVGSRKPDTPTLTYNFPPKRVTATTNEVEGAISYNWYLNTTLKGVTQDPSFRFSNSELCETKKSNIIGVRAVTNCGESEIAYEYVNNTDC